MRALPFGPATLLDLEIKRASERARRTRAATQAIEAELPGARVVAGAGVVLIEGGDVEHALAAAGRTLEAPFEEASPARRHVVPIVYDGHDLEEVGRATALSVDELTALHAAGDYEVELEGFLPGFAYLGPLDPRLVVPRRKSPRSSVAPRSVGIAGEHTGIYPLRSPGGWSLIGRALIDPFDARRERPSLFSQGDRVRFERVDPRDAREPATPYVTNTSVSPGGRALVVTRATPGATIQDLGRRVADLPPSGALDAEALVAANRAVDNEDGAAAIEIPLGSIALRARGRVHVSLDGARAIALADGETLDVIANGRGVRYVAVRGGVDAPIVFGARATLVLATIGGLEGRALRRGDVLSIGAETRTTAIEEASAIDRDARAPLVVLSGPHAERFPSDALPTLFASTFRVSRLGDRVGVRLEGPRIPRDRDDLALPAPMLRGAMQVTTDGTIVVLGPDHPITGGYPVIGVLDARSCARLARMRPGDELTFARA